jgi:phenylalanine-4-hydroxylase
MKDTIVSQKYSSYTEAQHFTWNELFERQINAIHDKACKEFLVGVDILKDLVSTLPNLEKISDELDRIVGWRLVPVIGFIDSQKYFRSLANKKFPVNINLRKLSNLDFDPLPDMWHDVFGHLPLITNPLYNRFLETISQKMLLVNDNQRRQLDNLYWYTIEAGMCQENGQRRIYGASQLSSFAEIHYSLSDHPLVRAFDFETVTQSQANPYDFQLQMFELNSFEDLAVIIQDFDLIKA